MFRGSIAIFLIITMMSTHFGRFFVEAGFELNQEYIASVLCENKSKPELNCNGKCYLSKKIKQVEEKEKKEEQQALRKTFQESFVCTLPFTILVSVHDIEQIRIPETGFHLPSGYTSIFHPPPASIQS